jgi:hypothetical protein
MRIGKCDKLYFAFEFLKFICEFKFAEYKRDQTPISHLSNKLNMNTYKPNSF